MTRFAAFLFAWLSLAVPAMAAELRVTVDGNFLIGATINGHAVRLRVDPETSGYIILNAEAVARIGLRRSMIGSRAQIGPVRLDGSSKVAELSIGGVTGDRRMVWIDREMVAGADGLIGPADMHYDRVVFDLGPARAGEASFELPLEFARAGGLFFPLQLGEDLLRVHFSLIKPDSLATAAAGARLSELNGGQWAGGPRDQLIHYGVSRPVRPLRLSRPVSLNGLLFSEFHVRTSDNRGDLTLPPDPDADPDEVVVTGSRQRARFDLTLGLDRLRQCSRLVWDNLSRRMILHCTNQVAAGG